MLSRRVPELASLELLVDIQATGSLSAAGEGSRISQQAASLRLRAMERQVGITLVTRSRRGSELTPEGVLLAQWADAVLEAARELDAGIDSLRGRRDVSLRVGASLTIAEHLAPRWFLALRAGQQQANSELTEVELVAANSDAVIAAVRGGQVALGFIESPGVPRDVQSQVVAHDRLVVVVAPDHPWARRSRPVSALTLARTPLVSRETGSGTREALLHALGAVLPDGVQPVEPAMALSSSAAVRAAIASGAAPGAMSELAVADDVALGRLVSIRVTGLEIRRDLRAIWLTGVHPPAGPARALVAVAAAGEARSGREVR